jgi:hypothetical protein
MLAHFYRDILRDGAGVGFLLGYAIAGQQVNNGLGLDLELAR